jgi:hypothetical protein
MTIRATNMEPVTCCGTMTYVFRTRKRSCLRMAIPVWAGTRPGNPKLCGRDHLIHGWIRVCFMCTNNPTRTEVNDHEPERSLQMSRLRTTPRNTPCGFGGCQCPNRDHVWMRETMGGRVPLPRWKSHRGDNRLGRQRFMGLGGSVRERWKLGTSITRGRNPDQFRVVS